MSAVPAAYRERIVRLGAAPGLAGVLTEPSGDASGAAVVMLNSGVLHRVGACRFHVKLARRLAAAGATSLRFDFSGIGDSEVRRDNLAFEQSAPLEIRESLDWLEEKRGIRRFALLGLCSGADVAFVTALQEPRIAELVLLDPWAYRTPRYWWVHYRSRVTSLSAWRRFLARKLAPAAAPAAPPSDPDLHLPTYVREFPPREQMASDLTALLARGARMLCVFSGGQPDDYNHEGQMRRGFRQVPFEDRLEERFLPDADHIFTDLDQQRRVLDTVEGWLAGDRDASPQRAAPGSASAAGSGI